MAKQLNRFLDELWERRPAATGQPHVKPSRRDAAPTDKTSKAGTINAAGSETGPGKHPLTPDHRPPPAADPVRHHPPSPSIPAPNGHAALSRRISPPVLGRPRIRANRLAFALVTLGFMLILKLHYSQASADQLAWILAPTARLVAWLTPAHPVFEHGVGHADFSLGIIIAPACAGVNFLIMAFGLTACCGLWRLARLKDLLAWMPLCLAGAYAFTLLINTLRIALSLQLYQADIYTGWLTPARLHRLTGVALYLGALAICHRMADAAARRLAHSPSRPPKSLHWLPLAWYLLGAVGVPLANALFRQRSPLFAEHGITLVLTSLILWCTARWLGRPILGKMRLSSWRAACFTARKNPGLQNGMERDSKHAGDCTDRGR